MASPKQHQINLKQVVVGPPRRFRWKSGRLEGKACFKAEHQELTHVLASLPTQRLIDFWPMASRSLSFCQVAVWSLRRTARIFWIPAGLTQYSPVTHSLPEAALTALRQTALKQWPAFWQDIARPLREESRESVGHGGLKRKKQNMGARDPLGMISRFFTYYRFEGLPHTSNRSRRRTWTI